VAVVRKSVTREIRRALTLAEEGGLLEFAVLGELQDGVEITASSTRNANKILFSTSF
jgi:hypothetical protein